MLVTSMLLTSMLLASMLLTLMFVILILMANVATYIFSQFLPKRQTQTIFDLGPKERFNMIREVHHVHQKSWKKHSKKMSKRNHPRRATSFLAPSSRHYLPEYTKQEISQSVYNIIVPCIIFSCYFIPKIIQELFQYCH